MVPNIIRLSIVHITLTVAVSGKVPCPIHDEDPRHFTDIPLTDRPKIAKILQHGFDPRRIQALTPIRYLSTKLNMVNATEMNRLPTVNFQDGFVDRPFRTISKEACKVPNWAESSEVTWKSHLICQKSSFAGFGGSSPSVETQFAFQMTGKLGRSFDYRFPDLFFQDDTKASFEEWISTVRDFRDCNDSYGTTKKSYTFMGCSISPGNCRTFDQEFLQDLSYLPTIPLLQSLSGPALNFSSNVDKKPKVRKRSTVGVRDAYQAFVDKWGYGSVEWIDFGAKETMMYPMNRNNDSFPVLYLGRSGGSNLNFSSKYIYTGEECFDPLPSELNFSPWDKVLEDFFFWDPIWISDSSDNSNGSWTGLSGYSSISPVIESILENMNALISNFAELRQSYPFFHQHFRDLDGSINQKCQDGSLTAAPTPSPSKSHSVIPTVSPTVATPSPTTLTSKPTAKPTRESSDELTSKPSWEPSPEPTSKPTLESSATKISLNSLFLIMHVWILLKL